MKREDDTIQFEDRDELRDVIIAMESIPESKKNAASDKLLKLLDFMDIEW